MKSQVTTKVGDKGTTRALDGNMYPKCHVIMDCVGTLDELRAHTAMLRLMVIEHKTKEREQLAGVLMWLLHAYFAIGSACSDAENLHPEYHTHTIGEKDVRRLEAEQQRLEEQTPLPHSFVVSAANVVSAQADITCTVARRLERALARLRLEVPAIQADDIVVFVNRLSDFLYMLARFLEHPSHLVVDYSVLE